MNRRTFIASALALIPAWLIAKIPAKDVYPSEDKIELPHLDVTDYFVHRIHQLSWADTNWVGTYSIGSSGFTGYFVPETGEARVTHADNTPNIEFTVAP